MSVKWQIRNLKFLIFVNVTRKEVNWWYFHLLNAQTTNLRSSSVQLHSSVIYKRTILLFQSRFQAGLNPPSTSPQYMEWMAEVLEPMDDLRGAYRNCMDCPCDVVPCAALDAKLVLFVEWTI